MSETTVLHNGDVHTTADPFATAIAFDGPTVSWIGSDEAAAEIPGTHIDLGEDFVSPGLVSAGVDLRDGRPGASADPTVLLGSGITAVHVVGAPEAIAAFRADAPSRLDIVAYPLGAADGPAALTTADLRAAVDAGALPPHPQFVLVDTDRQLGEVLAMLADGDVRTHAQRHGYRLLAGTPVPADVVAELAATGVALTVDPVACAHPLAELLAAGAQLSFVLDQASPWSTLRAAVFGHGGGVSARAAFNCATRFAHRAVGRFEHGLLAPGLPATAVRWSVDGLVVQAADSRVASWSTDPRSGTPGLPDLSPDATAPVLRSVWVDGVEVVGNTPGGA